MYKLVKPIIENEESKIVLRVEDNCFIPFDPDNTDYQAYLKWLEAGNTPLPADTGA